MTTSRPLTLLILGGTGLVGGQLVDAALNHPLVDTVVAPTRRPLRARAGLLNPLVDYAHLPEQALWWRTDAALCALGTTLKQAGSQAAFREVDYHYVLDAARLARQAGTPTFVLNSSLGADANARSFYLRTKGETERDLARLGFQSLSYVRPSLLDGGARPDARPAEAAGLWLARRLKGVIPSRYRAVSTQAVAERMLAQALAAKPGVVVVESNEIIR
ncbi:MAG: NAD-dependent dehydratase [Halopseudomonas sp.]